jgi:hypothetical protein
MHRRLLSRCVLLAVAACLGAALHRDDPRGVLASTETTGNALTARSIFPAQRLMSTWRVSDVTSGTAPGTSRTDQIAFTDAVTLASGAFGTAFSATRYVETSLAGPLPAGGTVTAAQLNLRFAAASGTLCIYVEVLRRSTARWSARTGRRRRRWPATRRRPSPTASWPGRCPRSPPPTWPTTSGSASTGAARRAPA